MPTGRQRVGAAGETAAVGHYQSLGYVVLARNFRCRAGEIDIIVGRAGEVVFSEVKTRTQGAFGSGAEAVTWQKRQRIRRVAATWLQSQGARPRRVRFDVVEVGPGGVTVIAGAF